MGGRGDAVALAPRRGAHHPLRQRQHLVGVFQDAGYEILVNDAGPFDGSRPIAAPGAVMFDVLADGPWTITLLPEG
jgi:hypothetical protein